MDSSSSVHSVGNGVPINYSFEGRGGDVRNLDMMELQNENSELKYQNRKLSSDLTELTKQLAQSEEAYITLAAQKEHLGKKLEQSKLNLDRIRDQFSRELEDMKTLLASSEDKNKVLRNRIIRLERDNAEIAECNEEFRKQIGGISADSRVYQMQLKELSEELRIQDEVAHQQIDHLISRGSESEQELKRLREETRELKSANILLARQKQELENTLFATISCDLKNPAEMSLCNDSAENDEDISASFVLNSPCHQNESLHSEIAASLGYPKQYSLPLVLQGLPEIDVGVQCNLVHRECPRSQRNVMSQLLKALQRMNQNLGIFTRTKKDVECEGVSTEEFPPAVEEEIADPEDLETTQEEVVRRINEELAEFRQQLKQSQELFHALNNSAQTFGVTQSCPLLADPEVPKPGLVNCSTQTDERTLITPTVKIINSTPMNPGEQSDTFEDADVTRIMDKSSIDGLDMESYRLAVNLPTVVEESEQEAESSPRSQNRRMNSLEKGPRPKLVRMANAVTDDVKSDLEDYQSAVSSLPGSLNTSTYNSLERPLHVSGRHSKNGNGGGMDDDTCSTISGENTTYGSPITSPSSPTYWTPSQGSSSQETLTNHDGDRTPVNFDRIDDTSLRDETDFSDARQKTLSWGISMPIDNRHGISSIGVIPESQQEHMKRYAYDAVARSCDPDAKILSRTEWRTLKGDLDAKEQDHYKKCFRQEDGGETDDGGGAKTSINMDLDDEAEEHCEHYPELAQELFQSLDVLKQSGQDLKETDLTAISQRFEKLSLVFKTDHMNLTARAEATTKSYEAAVGRMKEISNSIKHCLQKIRDHKLPGEIHEDLCIMEHTSQELDMYSQVLSKTARRAGRIDLETRVCKMIEVMVLYVHILKTFHRNSEEDTRQARELLAENNIPLPSKKSVGKLHHNNNNGNKIAWENDELDGSHSELMERFEDGKPKYALQHLLGPKKSNAGLNGNPQELVFPEKHSSENFLLRYLSEWYEIVRRELYWPWNWDQTWKGLKQGFSGFIMIVGILIIAGSVIPNVGAQHDECETVFFRLFSILSKYGYLSHNQVPRI